MKRAWQETKLSSFLGWGFLVAMLGCFGLMKFGVRTPHDTIYYVVVGFGSATIGACCAFLRNLIFLPSKIDNEEKEKNIIANVTISQLRQELQTTKEEKEQSLLERSDKGIKELILSKCLLMMQSRLEAVLDINYIKYMDAKELDSEKFMQLCQD